MKPLIVPAALLAYLVAPSAPEKGPMVNAAEEFLASLTPEQRKKAVYAFNSTERKEWMYVPGDRKGVAYFEMTQEQRERAQTLLRTVLSDKGFATIEEIRQHELILRKMENNNLSRDPDRYWFVFFGEPDSERPWAWRFEGHHTSLTFGSRGETVVSSTPQFLGCNPAEVRTEGPKKGERILAQEQDFAFALAETFTEEQKKKAVVAAKAPADIVTANSRQAGIEGHLGLQYDELTAPQQKILRDLIQVYCEVQKPEERKRRIDRIKKDGYDHVVIAWMGPISRGGRHYYRIQGESFLIEYDNTQDDGNHIHCVWRDLQGDFGDDLLKEHYHHDHNHTR